MLIFAGKLFERSQRSVLIHCSRQTEWLIKRNGSGDGFFNQPFQRVEAQLMEHTVNAFGVWADVAPDKFVLMLQGFKTGGLLWVHWVSLWLG